MKNLLLPAIVLTSFSSALLATDSDWSFGVEGLVRANMEITLSGGSRASLAAINDGMSFEASFPSIGSTSATADRTYADGYVFLDPGTNNSDAIGGPGLTWNWGFDNASQYDAAANSLTLTSVTSQTQSFTGSANSINYEDETSAGGIGFFVKRVLSRGNKLNWSLEGGLRIFFPDGEDLSYSTYTLNYTLTTLATVDTFDTTGVSVPTSPPYQGSFNGPGPVIANTPASRSLQTVSVESWQVTNAIAFSTDYDLFEFYLAPRADYQISEDTSLLFVPSIGASMAQIEAVRVETVTSGRNGSLITWTDQVDDDEWIFSSGLQVGISHQIDQMGIEALAGYVWASSEVDVPIGPNTLTFDPSGFTASVRFTYSF